MDKPKIHIDKPELTDDRMLKHKDFDKVMQQAAKMAPPPSPWGSWKLWTGATAVLVVGAAITFYIQTNSTGSNDSASNAASNENQVADVTAHVPPTENIPVTTTTVSTSGTTPPENATTTPETTTTTTVETGSEHTVNHTTIPPADPTPPVSKSVITVTPADTVFTANEFNFRKITLSENGKISRVVLNGGEVSKNGEFFKFAINDNREKVTLKVFEELPNGEEVLKFKQLYTIKKPALPSVYICGVKNGGKVDRQKLLREGKMIGKIELYNQNVQIMNFELNSPSGGKLRAQTSRFTVEMKRLIHQMKPGDTLNFVNIHGLMPDGTIKLLEPMSIRIADGSRTGVGQ